MWGKENKKIKKIKLCDNVTPSLCVGLDAACVKTVHETLRAVSVGKRKKKLCDNVTLSL